MTVSRTSRRTLFASAAVFILALVYLHHEVLLGGRVYHMDDAADGYYPSHIAILRAYAAGELPLWERGAWCGWPLVADPYYGPFYPLTLVYALVGAARGLGFQVALHALLGGAGMYALLRRRRLDLGPALLGAVSLAFGSFLVVRARHVIFVELMGWLPLVLYGLEGWLAERRVRDLALAGLAGGLGLLCGALPLAPFAALVAVAYALPRVLSRAAAREGRALALGGLGVAALVAGLVAAAQLLPTVAHMPESPRALGTDFAFASSYAWPGRDYLATLIAPDVLGGEDRAAWFGAFNHWEMAGYYAGAWVVLLAPFGLLRARRRPEMWALFAIAGIAVLLAFGPATPLHRLFFRFVPLYASLRCPTRALIMLLLAFPILAAEGLSWLLERPSGRPVRVGLGLCALALGAGALALHLRGRAPLPGPLHAQLHAFQHLATTLAAGALVLALGGARRQRAGIALAAVTLVDLVTIGRGYVQPKPPDYPAGMERYAAVDWLLAQKKPGELMDRFAPDPRGPFRLHNVGMVYGLEGAGGYDSVSVFRTVNYLWVLAHGAPYPWPHLRDDLAAGDVKRWSSPLVDLLNVRWAIAATPPAADWIERFRPPLGAPPHAKYEPAWDPQLKVYENPHVLPRAFVVHAAEVLPDGDAQARALARLDPRATAILDRPPEPAPVAGPLEPARVTAAGRHALTIEAEARTPGVLVVSETFYPGWSATLDGKPVPLLRADYALRGVALPAGKHVVEMRFRSRPAELGLALSALGLCAVVALWRLGRRGGEPPPVL